MKTVANVALVVALVSFALGVYSRIIGMPLPIAKYGLEAQAFLSFTVICLLISIVSLLFAMYEKQSNK